MKMIDADHLINEIEELKKSPWYNNIYGFIYRKIKYCPFCGQRLDWSEEE